MDAEIDLPKPMLFDWKKILAYVIPIAVLAGIFVAKLGSRSGRAEHDFVSATRDFVKWDQVLNKKTEGLVALEGMFKKRPELKARYDAPIAQKLLSVKSAKSAAPYVERTLERTHQPYYSDYARTSLLVGEEKYGEALVEARALKEKLALEKESSALFAFNLLRIATLCQELGDRKGELAAWEEMKVSSGHEGFKQLLSHFSVQETTLLDYIKSREEDLGPMKK